MKNQSQEKNNLFVYFYNQFVYNTNKHADYKKGDDMDRSKFAKRLRDLRKERQLTQEELSARLDLTKQAVSQWERGVREPGFETLEMIADFFNVDTDYLIGREDRTTLLLTGVEHELIVRFRELSPAERSLILRSVGINE